MGALRARIETIQERIAEAEQRAGVKAGSVQLVAVTKYATIEFVEELYSLGLRHMGESRAQQLAERAKLLPNDIAWHMIGHLQTNKINKVIPHTHLLHSLDSIDLAQAIDQRALGLREPLPVLLEVKTADEASKAGCPLSQAAEVYDRVAACAHLSVRGLMTMAPHTTDEKTVRSSFQQLRRLYESLASHECAPQVLSMGMSSDFEWAIEEGANMVRIGSTLVGS